jgi:hypothetical protein
MQFQSLDAAIGFCAKPIPGGWTWTLTSLLGAFLVQAEEIFGLRDRNWTPVGVQFGGDRAHVTYPLNCGLVAIVLPERLRSAPERAAFEMAHEVVHLLSPTGGNSAPVIEEGAATAFSHLISGRFELGIQYHDPDYKHAEGLVAQFLALDPLAIKRLREREPSFARFTPSLIRSAYPTTSESLAEALCQPFSSLAHLRAPG